MINWVRAKEKNERSCFRIKHVTTQISHKQDASPVILLVKLSGQDFLVPAGDK